MTPPDRRDDADDALLDAAVAAVLAEEIPPGPPPAVAGRLAEAHRKPAAGSPPLRRRSRSRAVAWIAAASVLLGGVLFWQLLEPRSNIALADVAEVFRGAKSLQFRVLMYTYLRSEQPVAAKWRTVSWIESSWKAPGFHREVTYGDDGVPWRIETRDDARGIKLDVRLTQREATWTDDGPPSAHQLRQGLPSNLAMLEDWLQYGQVQQELGEKVIQGRKTVGLRVVYGDDRKADFWVDRRTRQIVRVQEPTADEYDPDNDPFAKEGPPPGTKFAGTEMGGSVWTDFVYDLPLDAAQYVLTPPADYKVQRIRHRNPTEKDFLEWLEVFAHVNGGTFTDNENPPLSSLEEINRLENTPVDKRTPWEQKLLRDGYERESTETGEFPLKGGGRSVLVHFWSMYHGTWHYQGKGVRLGDAQTPVCWYRPDGAATYRVVFGDLSVRDVAPEDLPKLRRADGTGKAADSGKRPDDDAR